MKTTALALILTSILAIGSAALADDPVIITAKGEKVSVKNVKLKKGQKLEPDANNVLHVVELPYEQAHPYRYQLTHMKETHPRIHFCYQAGCVAGNIVGVAYRFFN